jgi:hypothetical protein
VLTALASIALIIGCFGPWIEFPGATFSGLDGVGWPTLVLGVAALVLSGAYGAFKQQAAAIGIVIAGAISTVITVAIWLGISVAGHWGGLLLDWAFSGSEGLRGFVNSDLVTLRWGLTVAWLGAAALLVTGMFALRAGSPAAPSSDVDDDLFDEPSFADDVEITPPQRWR